MRTLLAICIIAAALLAGIQEGYAYDALDLETLKTKGSCPNCNLRGAKLKGAKLKGVNLEGANLQGANLQKADLKGANLEGANLQWAKLQKADLRGANLEGASLSLANLVGANLTKAILRGAKLIWTDLQGANLQKADLRGAQLKGTKLQNAKLQKADLRRAKLQEVELRGANLKLAKLDSGDLAMAQEEGAIGIDPSGSDVSSITPPKEVATTTPTPPKTKQRARKAKEARPAAGEAERKRKAKEAEERRRAEAKRLKEEKTREAEMLALKQIGETLLKQQAEVAKKAAELARKQEEEQRLAKQKLKEEQQRLADRKAQENSQSFFTDRKEVTYTKQKITALKQLYDGGLLTENEYQTQKASLLQKFLGLQSVTSGGAVGQDKKKFESISDIKFGQYHALVIGNNNYKHLPKLKTAVDDAKAVAAILEKEYRFKVTLMLNANQRDTVDAFDELTETLGYEDNLLIYYAGHGWLNEESGQGYWLPVDAQTNRRSRWVSNSTLKDTLKTVQAKHVMVVADSCFSGTLVRGASTKLKGGDYWRRMAEKRARVALVSGGLEPVADADGKSTHSPFAKAFIDALRENDVIIDGTTLFNNIRRPVMVTAQQTPAYSDVRNAGHDGGDFLFVRKN